MLPLFHPSLVNGRYGDLTVYVETLFEKHSLLLTRFTVASEDTTCRPNLRLACAY